MKHSITRWTKGIVAVVAVVGAAALGTVILTRSHAATPVLSAEPEAGTITAPAQKTADSAASGGSSVSFMGTTVGTAKPLTGNTGVPAGTSLTIVNGDQVYSTANQVISGLDIRGYVQITGKNVTIKNSIIRGGVKSCTSASAQNSAPLWVRADTAASAIIQDVEISPSNATACMDGIWASNSTLSRVNVHGAVDGIKAYDNLTIQDSYIHDLAHFASDPNQGGGETHNDGIQSYECNANVKVLHNNIDLSTTTGGNAAYQITQDGGKACSGIVISDNWLNGGGCTLNIAHKVLTSLTGVSVTGNRFGRSRSFANCLILLSTRSTLTANTGNVWDDTGAAIPAPTVHD
jgi:hypothetical protein